MIRNNLIPTFSILAIYIHGCCEVFNILFDAILPIDNIHKENRAGLT